MKSSSPFGNNELAKLIEMLQGSDFEKGKCIMPGVYEVETEKGEVYKIGGLVFCAHALTLIRNQQPIKLRKQEALLLRLFLAWPYLYVSRQVLMEALWEDLDTGKVDCNGRLNVTIDRLKRSLKAGDPNIRILCERGVGYKLFVHVPENPE